MANALGSRTVFMLGIICLIFRGIFCHVNFVLIFTVAGFVCAFVYSSGGNRFRKNIIDNHSTQPIDHRL